MGGMLVSPMSRLDADESHRLSGEIVAAIITFVCVKAVEPQGRRPLVVAGLVSTASFGGIHRGVACRDQLDK